MSLIKAPAQHPDVQLRRDPNNLGSWLSKTWDFEVWRDGIPMILTDSTFTLAVLDNDVEIGTLAVDATLAADGVLAATITNDLIKVLGHYTTWQLYEAPQYNDVLVQGRFVKQI